MDLTGIPFTKVYRSILTSSVWTTPHPKLHMVRCVWMALLFLADRHGNVLASIPGLATAAVVSVEDVEEALTYFKQPDRYSRTPDESGRRLVEIPGGWRLLNYNKYHDLAKLERLKEQKREWYHRQRAGDEFRKPVLGIPNLEESSKTGSISLSSKSDQDRSSDPPDQVEASTQRAVYRSLDGWEPKPELYARATECGLTREQLDERIAELRNGPIGGNRGVFDRDSYVMRQLPKWRAWAETAKSDAVHRPGSTNGARGPLRGRDERGFATGARYTGWGGDLLEFKEFSERQGLDLGHLRYEFIRSGVIDACSHSEADKLFAAHLKQAARAKRKGGT